MDIDKIINTVRSLKEDAVAPTNSVSGGQIAGTKEAGDDPPVRKTKKYIYGKGFRLNWLQRRTPPQ